MMETVDAGTIVDAGPPEEFTKGHFPDANNIPLDQVALRINEF